MKTAVHMLAPELAQWDRAWERAPVDALVLPFFSDERPLRGAAGLADWRLCGRLSQLRKTNRIKGEWGEVLLLPPAKGRLPLGRLFLFGLGASPGFDEARYRKAIRGLAEVLAKAKMTSYALQPPGRALGLIAARRALELWLDEVAGDVAPVHVTFIETPGAQKEIAPALRHQNGDDAEV